MKRFSKCLTAMILCAIILSGIALPALAAAPATLRVAFYPLEGFFEYDDQGNETGYGVELLNRIARYTGLRFSYVPAESWEETKTMLLNGEADIRMPGTLPLKPSETLGYTQHSILDTYYAMMALDKREDLIYDDFETFQNLKIGISKSLYEATPVKNYLQQLNLSEKNLVFYEQYNDCRAALQQGAVDAIISNIMDMDKDMKLVGRFSSRANYISMTINNPNIDILDDALYRIKAEDPGFFNHLYAKWFPERAVVPFTKEETEFLASMDHLDFYFGQQQGYLSRKTEDGTYQGFYPTLARKICEKLGVSCDTYDPESDARPANMVVPDFYYEYLWADQMNAAITEPYDSASYYEITHKGSTVDKKTAKVAAVKEYRVTRDYIADGFSSAQMVWCSNYAECMEAVYRGRADVTFINRYVAEYYLSFYRYNGLSATLTDYSHQICFAVIGENKKILASILEKSLASVSTDEMNALMVDQTSTIPEQNLFAEWFYHDPLHSVMWISGAVAVLMFLLAAGYANHRGRRQNIALEKAVHIKQDFLSRISHDMRTPMNAIISFSRFGVESKRLSESKEYHEKTLEASEYLLHLINDTLESSELEAGTLKIHPEPYSATEFIATISNILLPRAEEKGVVFTVENNLSNPKLAMFDKLRLQQICINLINNAIKFTPEGGHVTLKIEARHKKTENFTAVFSVIDDGIGMTEEFQEEMMYKPFEQERRMENEENGTGLGLSIVKELVQAMGGTIACQSAPGQGTTFTVTLPSKVVEEKTPQNKDKPNWKKGLAGKKILICEDHPLNRQIARKLLENVEIYAEEAENGKLGLEKFAASKIGFFDAILMDIRMPILNGLETAKEIRKLDRPDAKKIPIVAMTANVLDEDMEQSINAGMNAHLAKPIDPDQLYQTLFELMDAHKKRWNRNKTE